MTKLSIFYDNTGATRELCNQIFAYRDVTYSEDSYNSPPVYAHHNLSDIK